MRRIRSALTFSNTIALVALMLSVSGTAYAAGLGRNSVGSLQVKNGSLLLADLSTTAKAALKGAAGATGAAGAPGTTGATGATGAPGSSAHEPMPAGATVSGEIHWDAPATAGMHSFSENIRFGSLAPAAVENADIRWAPTGNPDILDGDESAACTGTVDEPTAPAGKLCLYSSVSNNLADGSLRAYAYNTASQRDTGFYIYMSSQAAGPMGITATWAYTAS